MKPQSSPRQDAALWGAGLAVLAFFGVLGVHMGSREHPRSVWMDAALLGAASVALAAVAVLIVMRRRDYDLRLELAMEGASIGMWDWDIDTGHLSYDRRWYAMLGYTPGDIGCDIGSWENLLHPEDREPVMATLRTHLRGQTAMYETEHRIKNGQGGWTWVLDRGRITARHRDRRPRRMTGTYMLLGERKEAENLLRLSEERFRQLLQNVTTVAVQGYAADGTTQYWNHASELLYGYTAAEAIGRNLLDLIIPPAMRSEVAAAVKTMAATGAPIPAAELTLQHKDGSAVEVYSSHAVVKLTGGKAELFCIDVDLKERKRMEEALRRGEAMFARVFHHSPVMMALCEAGTGKIIEVNEIFARTLGYDRREIVGRTSVDAGWLSSASRDRIQNELLTMKQVRDAELTLRSKTGEAIHTLYSGELVELDGKPCVMSAWRDVSERRRVEAQLRLLSEALQAAANAIMITDRAGSIVWVNAASESTTGYSFAEMVGQNPRQLIRSGVQSRDFYAELWRTITAGKVWSGEMVNRRRNGTHYTEHVTITPLQDGGGDITHFIAVKQDITGQKELERQFRQSQKMEAVGQLAGGVAHDFNNILAALLLNFGVLQENPAIDPAVRRTLKDLEKETRRGASLTRQLLTFSRQQAMDCHELNVNEVLTGLMKMLRRLLGEHIEIVLQLGVDLPEVNADAGMLEQVITNLCVNARDAMPEGGCLTLETSVIEISQPRREARAGQFVRLDVSDTGCGMDELTLQKIFEPFFTTKPPGHGTGLGLSTVYGIVRQHQGWIEVESKLDLGSTFHVYLPAVLSASGPSRAKPLPTLERGQGEVVLVAEDDDSVRAVVVEALALHGYRVQPSGSGPEALEQWQRLGGRVDLLVTDMVMPGGMNGRQLLAALRAKNPALKAILCTGYSQELTTANALPDRETVVLKKPFDVVTLLAAVRKAIAAKTA